MFNMQNMLLIELLNPRGQAHPVHAFIHFTTSLYDEKALRHWAMRNKFNVHYPNSRLTLFKFSITQTLEDIGRYATKQRNY
jgi:hypothetical protein